MGIKYLYNNLLSLDLIKIHNKQISKQYLYIDLDCIFYTYAHICESDNELINKIVNIIEEYINNDNHVTVFYDSGIINKKINENNKRTASSLKHYNNIKDVFKQKYNMNDSYEFEYKTTINNISTQTKYTYNNNNILIDNVEEDFTDNYTDDNIKSTQTCFIFDQNEYNICEDNVNVYKNEVINILDSSTIIENKKQFYSMRFNLEKDKKKILKQELLNNIKKTGVNIVTKEGIDAELYMIYKCIKIHKKNKIWPLCLSKDQDTIALSIINIPYNIFNIVYDNKLYKIKKNSLSINLVILSLIFNESDYFGGIYGYSFSGEKIKYLIDIIEDYDINNLLDYFNIEYIKNLCKKLFLKTINEVKLNNILKIHMAINNFQIEKYLYEISLYLLCNENFYNTGYNNQIDKNEFIKYIFLK
ncbi:hypothetical protein AMV179 [Betaentomopoxvirus amoorei]|uniref:AMV179 n=1 Tax=Amsacta moorei entomopoxvirus TaxID=28321 RepID=Q9EMM2_AMEPV|nr:hypothetical protein AMV179 [Amsacta moorei entomopoxvirus]AAG02885.1 AMV179 [Amsacta moorei entomopoxvirus]